MKSILNIIREDVDGFNSHFSTHAKAYNDLIKWYDKHLKHMNKEELIGCLKSVTVQFENDNFDTV